jgi:hypothetical protein
VPWTNSQRNCFNCRAWKSRILWDCDWFLEIVRGLGESRLVRGLGESRLSSIVMNYIKYCISAAEGYVASRRKKIVDELGGIWKETTVTYLYKIKWSYCLRRTRFWISRILESTVSLAGFMGVCVPYSVLWFLLFRSLVMDRSEFQGDLSDVRRTYGFENCCNSNSEGSKGHRPWQLREKCKHAHLFPR